MEFEKDENGYITSKQIYDLAEANGQYYPAYYVDEKFKHYPYDERYLISNRGANFSTIRNKFNSQIMGSKQSPYLKGSFGHNKKDIHRAVMQTFEPRDDEKDLVVNHKDSCRQHNYWDPDPNKSNLEWCTQKENVRHAINTGRLNQKGENSCRTNYTNQQADEFCQLMMQGKSSKEIACQYGITYNNAFSHFLTRLRKGESFPDVTSKYPDLDKYRLEFNNNIPMSDEDANKIGYLMSQRKTTDEIANEMGFDITDKKMRKRLISLLSSFRTGQSRPEIKKKYNL